MRIGLDFGGVIANHQVVKLRLAQEMFGLTVKKVADVERANLLPIIGKQRYQKLAEQTSLQTPSFPLVEGLLEALTSLTAKGDTFHIISTQSTVDGEVVQKYLTTHQLPITGLKVVAKDEGKLAACRAENVQLFIDDSPTVLHSLASLRVPLYLARFLGEKPIDPTNIFSQVFSWKEFADEVRPNLDFFK